MHVRSNHQQSEAAVESAIELDIGVLQLRVQGRKEQIDGDDPEWNAEDKDRR